MIPSDFNCEDYKNLNVDLKNLSEKELKNHYLKFGLNEKRLYKNTLPDDFNCKDYKKLNIDLKDLSEEELKNHYLKFGLNEERLYKNTLPDDFNCEDYKKLNIDLKYLNEEELIIHYLQYGKYESRIYKNIEIDNSRSNTLYFAGGICNMLFQISILISFCYDNNLNFYLNNDSDERKYDTNKLFKNISYNNNISNYIYTELGYKFNNINVDINNNILFKGYFQSYKYFWHNIKNIKNYLNFDEKISYWLSYKKHIFNTESKKILGIHIRLTDYIKSSETHINMPNEYYKKALSNINLLEYKIILFSDDTIKASEILNSIEIYNFICADDINNEDLEQLIFLSVTDVRICVNSTYSLWSCYINDIYELNNNALYIFPNLWFGPEGPDYNIHDLIPENNNKYKIIDVYKCAVIFFHKNIYNIYNKYWIQKCIDSVVNQINVPFDIYEVNYGNEDKSIFDNYNFTKKINKYFFKKNYKTHTEAMIYILNKCFNDNNYDIVFNTNLDDYYNSKRFIYQIYDINKNNSFLNSTMWTYISQKSHSDEIDIICNSLDNNKIIYEDNNFKWIKDDNIENYPYSYNIIDTNIIKTNILSLNNLINHSGVCFTKKFWNSLDKYNNKLKYRNDKPYEDISFWYRAFENNINITIINRNLIYYRIHQSQIGSQLKEIQNSGIKKDTFCDGPNLIDYQIGILVNINFSDIYKIKNLNKNIFSDRQKYYFLYIHKNDEIGIIEYLNNLSISYSIICYDNNKLEDYNNIVNLFDVSIELNSDYLYIIKELNNDFTINSFDIENNNIYKVIKV